MGNNTSVAETEEAAQKLYQKMKKKEAYVAVTIWKYTMAFLEKTAGACLESGAKFLLKKIMSLAPVVATFAVPGLGLSALACCLAADKVLEAPEDISSITIEKAIHKVLNEEKALEICNIIDAYKDRCIIFAKSKEKLCEEANIYERDLFNQLKRTSNPMLQNTVKATVLNFYSWLKGARFHLEMLSQLITLGVRNSNEVFETAVIHSNTMNKLGAAVRKQKTSVIVLIYLPLCIKLTDKEAGQTVYIFHTYCNLKNVKNKYLELLFDEQIKSVEEEFINLIADFKLKYQA